LKAGGDEGLRFPLWARIGLTSGADLAIAGSFLITWISPYALDERAVHKLTFVMLVEFLVVHSTGFFTAFSSKDSMMSFGAASAERAERRRRAIALFGLLAFYLLFAAAFSASYGSAWPIFAFVGVSLPRFPALIRSGQGDDETFRGMATWAAMTALYLAGVAVTAVADIPPLGVTADVIASQKFGIGGLWPEQPYRALAFGSFYFTGMAIIAAITELLDERRFRKTASR
jgi:hypothetical protein